ncbi:YbhB/YbcL family Raf kinase inhibitor-like protein [Methanolobus profundi]|uniref:Phospholipid-binding protein, PBP family n=1 Tax=Methanolobus profundi TaxID=487685 RepID=A0A1I4U2M2_9EURY|nr:YbhB/YbcL family Raf kinase inhibitor-like protein [Methanolobus profundi]SFM82963.1 hypothetical protein SAMN04488696_2505 [Methanolobus profundi]
MSGVNSPGTHLLKNIVSIQSSIGITAVIILFLFMLPMSGCVEPAVEEPDDVPDPYDVNITPDEPSVPQELINDAHVAELKVTSSAFENGSTIPELYTCDSENINPALEVSDIPDGVGSLLLIMDDPDAPMGTFTHWVVWNIRPDEQIDEDSVPGVEGANGAGKASYTGPCPPSGTHRYFFKFYALDTEIDIESGSERSLVEDAMDGHVVAYGELVGLYSRS